MADENGTRPLFARVSSDIDFPALDRRVLAFWDEIDAFRRSVELRPPESEYTFYDGPPFATGSPHYGHLLQGIVKDIVPRYWTMRGHRVERRFGWDTHGLPVEMEVEKQLGVRGPKEIEALGVTRFNEAARALVENTAAEWYDITRRMGRWVDLDDAYRTMDLAFMESVWWGFRQLWDKGLIYRAFKVLPYSWGATTPISNFEVNLGGYRDVDDPSITVRLRVIDGHGPARTDDWLLIWTTTPWTLPGNLGIAVGATIDYVCVLDDGDRCWIADELISSVWKDGAPEIVARARGLELVGTEYAPPFDYFEDRRGAGAFRILLSDDVTTTEGTGLVHMAPAYGEADFEAFHTAGLDVIVDPVDFEAKFTAEVPEVAGMHVKDADGVLIGLLRDRGLLVHQERITHSYPFCWRTETPLIYKAIPSWYVDVQKIKDRMVALNKTVRWVPDYVGERRFGNWLEEARDYAISRNRFWGSTIPVWTCDGCDEQVCVGSLDELEELSGERPDDLHKHVVDQITWACLTCEGTMRRVPEVLDTWYDSGSMPFASTHYPFENAERFEQGFPADFIAEGLDQTRGWFYTLLVLSTGVFDMAPFQNCVVTGMILAEDGRKMSKSLRNYPDPGEVLDSFGADALRAYIINSPLLRADPLRFSEAGVREVVRSVLIPLWNAYSFFTTYAEADDITAADLAAAPPLDERPEIDRWIVSVLQSLVADVNHEMESYRLFAVIPPIIGFVDHLTNWYIRRSRRRFWSHRGTGNESDKLAAFATLADVLATFAKVSAPVIPFVTEEIYQGMRRSGDIDTPESVHHCDYPEADAGAIDDELERGMATVRTVVTLGRALRKQNQLKVRQPLARVTVVTRDPRTASAVETHGTLISEELNVHAVEVHADEAGLVDLSARANFRSLGPRLGKRMSAVAAGIAGLDHAEVAEILDGNSIEVEGETIGDDEVVVVRTPRSGTVVATEGAVSVALDTDLTDELRTEGIARELISRLQGARRDAGLAVSDRVAVRWYSEAGAVGRAFVDHHDLIAAEILATSIEASTEAQGRSYDVNGMSVLVAVDRIPD